MQQCADIYLLQRVLIRPRWKEVAVTSVMTCTRGSGYSF